MMIAIEKIKDWCRRNENRNAFILIFACILGVFAGFGAFLLKSLIRYIALGLHLGISHIGIARINPDCWLFLLPLAGILLAVFWQKKVARCDMVHSTRHIVEYLNSKNYNIPGRIIFNPIVACGITLGFGGSAGAEGPIAYAGAATGSRLGRALGLDPDLLRIMIGIGAGAGIAGIFKSPVAGMLFTLEVLKMNMGAAPVIGLLMSCVFASVTCYAFTGTSLYLPFSQTGIPDVPFHWICLLGVFCGIYSVAYNVITHGMQVFFKTRKRAWVTWLTGGLTAGAILMMFPSIYGEGYPIMTQLINGDVNGVLASGFLSETPAHTLRFMALLAALLVMKALATVCSNSAGGVAGDFAPTLFAGAVGGTLFSMAMQYFFNIDIPVSLCALFAMSGTFAGIVHAPVMAIFLITEISGTFQYIFPITLCAAASYFTVKLIHPAGTYLATRNDDIAALMKNWN